MIDGYCPVNYRGICLVSSTGYTSRELSGLWNWRLGQEPSDVGGVLVGCVHVSGLLMWHD
jgi:hypothetical protein